MPDRKLVSIATLPEKGLTIRPRGGAWRIYVQRASNRNQPYYYFLRAEYSRVEGKVATIGPSFDLTKTFDTEEQLRAHIVSFPWPEPDASSRLVSTADLLKALVKEGAATILP